MDGGSANDTTRWTGGTPPVHAGIADAADLAALFDAVPGRLAALAVDAPRYTVLAATDSFCDGARLPRAAILGRGIFEVFPDAPDRDDGTDGAARRRIEGALRESLDTVLRTRAAHRMAVQRYDLPVRGAPTHPRYWEPLNTPVLGPDGAVRYVLHAAEDVTERVQRQADADAAARREGRILEQISDAHVTLDGDFRLRTVNAAAERMLGVERAHLVGRTIWDAFPATVGADIERQYRRVRDERVEAHFVHHYVDARLDLHVEIDAYPTDEGGLALFWRDVSRRMHAETALRESEGRFRLMADAVPQIVWLTDAEGRTEFFNRHWFAYTGAREMPPDASTVAERYVHPDDRAPTMEAFAEARRTSGTFSVEHRIRAASGEYRWFLVRAEPQRDPATGAITRWFGASTDIHDRRVAEAALRESEARYRSLFETIDEGFCVLEVLYDAHDRPVDYRFLETNPAFAAQTGLVDAPGHTARELVPTLESHWIETYGHVATTGESMRFAQGSDAMGRWFDVYAFRIGRPDQRRVALLFRDVSAARAVEAERAQLWARLASERERLRSLIRSVPAPVALHAGPEHRFEILSDSFRHVSGGRDLTGLSPQEAYPELVGHGILERFDEVVATGRPWIAHEVHARFDRRGTGIEDTWFDIRYEPMRDEQGEVVGILNFSFDVTEQVRARREVERLLAESERARAEAEAARAATERARERTARLQALTASLARARTMDDVANAVVADMVVALDARTGALAVRAREDGALVLLRTEGFPEPVAQGVRRQSLDFRSPLPECFRSGAPIWVEQRDGPMGLDERYPPIAPVWDALGVGSAAFLPLIAAAEVVGVISFAFVGSRTFSASDREFLMTLGQQAALAVERARLFESEREARQDAEAANRAKAEFLATMSHELRTPLNAIGGYAELIELGIHGPVTDAQRVALERIQRSQRHLLGLIAGVLDYSRLEAGAVTYHLADVPVAEAVAEAEVLVAPQLRAKGLGYAWSGAAPGLCVRADREKLQQILLNLLSNAVKFTHAREDRPGRIEVSCAAEGDAPAARVCIRVRDTGAGISADKLVHVFEPFVQVDQRLTRPSEGVGLGLAISRDLARGMGGDLTAESTPGQGSTFTLTLPAA